MQLQQYSESQRAQQHVQHQQHAGTEPLRAHTEHQKRYQQL